VTSCLASLGWMSLEFVASSAMALLECHLEDVTSENDQAVADALGEGAIRLLRPEYLLSVQGVLPRCQDLPPEAFLSPEDAKNAYLSARGEVGSLSYRWRFEQHPDPDGEQLKQLQKMLRMLPQIKGVFWDWPSLPQKGPNGRSVEEIAVLKRALKLMGFLYSSVQCTTVLTLKNLPDLPATSTHMVRPYHRSGWCSFEVMSAKIAAGTLFGVRKLRMQMRKHRSGFTRARQMAWSFVVGLQTGIVSSTYEPMDDELSKETSKMLQMYARPKLIDISEQEPLAYEIPAVPTKMEAYWRIEGATFTNGKDESDKVIGMLMDLFHQMAFPCNPIKLLKLIGSMLSKVRAAW